MHQNLVGMFQVSVSEKSNRILTFAERYHHFFSGVLAQFSQVTLQFFVGVDFVRCFCLPCVEVIEAV